MNLINFSGSPRTIFPWRPQSAHFFAFDKGEGGRKKKHYLGSEFHRRSTEWDKPVSTSLYKRNGWLWGSVETTQQDRKTNRNSKRRATMMHRWIDGFIWPFQGKPPPRAGAKFKRPSSQKWKPRAVRPSSGRTERTMRNSWRTEKRKGATDQPATMIAQHVICKTVR